MTEGAHWLGGSGSGSGFSISKTDLGSRRFKVHRQELVFEKYPFGMGLLVPNLSFFAGLVYFSPNLRVYATPAAPPATAHPSIKESTKGGRRRRRRPPFVEVAEGHLLYGWVCGGWGCSRRGRNTQVRRKISKSSEK